MSDSLTSPTLVLCQEHKWNNGVHNSELEANFSDKDWVLKQFFRLNDKMNIYLWFHGFLKPDTLNVSINTGASLDGLINQQLTIGNNSISINGLKSKFIVKELLNPWNGLCYAIIPDRGLEYSKPSMRDIRYQDDILRNQQTVS